jgi:RNA recognition motif-containing protein
MSERSVFIGNLPYDASEEELTNIMREAGAVVSVRIVYDKETGQARGFAYCEYANAGSTFIARHNLNGRAFNGRVLRVTEIGEDVQEAITKRARDDDPAPEPPAKKRRLTRILDKLQTTAFQLEDLSELGEPTRTALFHLIDVLQHEKKTPEK